MWLLAAGLCAGYLILRSIYRLYFHPLSHFPGPRLAAISHTSEFYHDVIRNGKYIWEVEKMHEKYGPIVRINPRELHIKDPHYYDEIYASASRKRDKDPKFVGSLGLPNSMLATVNHEHHRFRRAILNPFFSKKAILEIAPIIESKLSKLVTSFERVHLNDEVLRLDDAFAALTADITTEYAWGVCSNHLDDSHFNKDIRRAFNEVSIFFHIFRFFPYLGDTLRALPRWLLCAIRPGAVAILDMQDTVLAQSNALDKGGRRTALDALSDLGLPSEERIPGRVEDEGLLVVVAGTETTGRTLTLAAYYVLRDKELLAKLREELFKVSARIAITVF